MKRILAALLIAALCLTAAFAMADTYSDDGSAIYYDTPYTGKTTESNVALRASAYARGQIIDTLRKGVRLTVTGAKYASDGTLWYQAETTSRKSGWVAADQVTFEETASQGGGLLDSLFGTGYASYIGNVNTHVFHLPGCRVLPKRENQTGFSSRQQALAEGYRPCGICKP